MPSSGVWRRSEMYRNKSGREYGHLSPCSSVHTWLNETKARRNTVIIIIIEVKGGLLSHLPDTFNRHCNLSLSCPRTSIANEFMKPFTESRTTCLCHLAAGTWGSLLGPAGPWPSPWLWIRVQSMARYAPSGSNIHSGSTAPADTCMCCIFQQHEEPGLT